MGRDGGKRSGRWHAGGIPDAVASTDFVAADRVGSKPWGSTRSGSATLVSAPIQAWGRTICPRSRFAAPNWQMLPGNTECTMTSRSELRWMGPIKEIPRENRVRREVRGDYSGGCADLLDPDGEAGWRQSNVTGANNCPGPGEFAREVHGVAAGMPTRPSERSSRLDQRISSFPDFSEAVFSPHETSVALPPDCPLCFRAVNPCPNRLQARQGLRRSG